MFNTNSKANDVLEKFRIKAHLRSYVRDPVPVDEELLIEAIQRLKRLPYNETDPSAEVASNLVLEAYRLGHYKRTDLTDEGYRLVSKDKYRGHHQLTKSRTGNTLLHRNRYAPGAI